ncbi:MAG: oligosaccharide flippase family protein [bacterium]|nr:oligosaccharide flippase family protein [bacterium]
MENSTSTSADGLLRERALRGTLISLSGQGGAQALRLLSNLILARLLFPEAFGVMAIAWLMINALTMISDVGVRSAVVRDDRGDDVDFLDTAWSIQVVRGLVLWLVALVLAAPIAGFYGEPQLRTILPVAALTAVLAGLESTKLITLTRHLTLGRVIAVELGGQVAGLVATICYALVFASVWALVAGALVMALIRVLASQFALAGPRNRFCWDRDAAHRIIHFGKWILVSTLITFLATRLDVIVVGKLVPMAALGVYSIGTMITQVPGTIASKLARAVLLPVFSASRRESPEALSRGFAKARSLSLPAGLAAILGTETLAPAFIHYLYPPEYSDAGWIAQLSMITLWFTFLQVCARPALIALGNSRGVAITNFVKLIASAVGCVVGFRFAGLPGLIVGVGVGAFCGYLTMGIQLSFAGIHVLAKDLGYTAVVLLAGAVIGLGPRLGLASAEGSSVALWTLALGVALLSPVAILLCRRLWRIYGHPP